MDFLDTGVIVVALRHEETTWLREMLKMSVRSCVYCSAQCLRAQPGMLSGPAPFLGVILFKILQTSARLREYPEITMMSGRIPHWHSVQCLKPPKIDI